jgi:hypothetical protein
MIRFRQILAALALVTAALAAGADPAAAGPNASHWCNRYQPHPAADREHRGNSYWYAMNAGMVTARCLAYEGSWDDGLTRLHYYHVTIADYDGDGDIDASWWTPLNPYTW